MDEVELGGRMRALLQDNRSGALEVAELPAPALRGLGALVRTGFSLISAGTERSTRQLAQKSLVGKALARPEEARKVVDLIRREGLTTAYQRVSAKLDTPRPLGYSSAGIILEVSPELTGSLLPGQRVA